MKYNKHQIDTIECPTDLQPTNSKKDEVDVAGEVIKELANSMQGRAIRNLNEILKVAECNDGLKGIADVADKSGAISEEAGNAVGSFNAELKQSSILRELVEDRKTSLCRVNPCIQYTLENRLEDAEILNSFGKPGLVRDPEVSSNLYEVFEEPKGEEIGNSINFCLEEDGGEVQIRIEKQIKTELGKMLVDSLDMSILDDISKQTYILEGELKKLGEVKEENFTSVENSLNDAKKILDLERKQIISKMLNELSMVMPCDYFDLPVDEQRALTEAQAKLTLAANLYDKSSFEDLNKVGNGSAKNAVLDAFTLWPKFKEDPRAIHLMDKIIEIDN